MVRLLLTFKIHLKILYGHILLSLFKKTNNHNKGYQYQIFETIKKPLVCFANNAEHAAIDLWFPVFEDKNFNFKLGDRISVLSVISKTTFAALSAN